MGRRILDGPAGVSSSSGIGAEAARLRLMAFRACRAWAAVRGLVRFRWATGGGGRGSSASSAAKAAIAACDGYQLGLLSWAEKASK